MSKELLAAVQAKQVERIIRLKELCLLTGLSRTTIWRRTKDGSGFPSSFRVSVNVVGWKLSDVTGWMNSLQINGGV
jgi:predicted DNA-binding transcriptional regulator AlpA